MLPSQQRVIPGFTVGTETQSAEASILGLDITQTD